jgi:hypothetical protein
MRPRVLVMADLAAPALTALLLCACLAMGELSTLRTPNVGAYFERVAGSIDGLPYKVGDFFGTPVDVTPAAVQLLRPNRLSQRAYYDPDTGRGVTLLLVHCKDVRDMGGHFPPNCYPAHGWRREGDRATTVRLAGEDRPARIYEFSQRVETSEERMHVLNFFVAPNRTEPVVADVSGLDRVTGSRRAVGLGAAQVQIVVTDPTLLDEASGVIARFMEAIEPAVLEIVKGPTSE